MTINILWLTGTQQPTHSRLPAKPSVVYEKGGCDFRTPWNTSSLGKQPLAKDGARTAARPIIGSAPRFDKSETCGPGPSLAQPSALQKQLLSHKKSAAATSFGTSTRDSALKMYSLYTAKR